MKKHFLTNHWKSMTLQAKLTSMFIFAAVVILTVNVVMYIVINEMTGQVENVYKSNVSLNDLSEDLETLQSNMEEYLQTRSSDAMEDYYRSEQEYRTSISVLNVTISDDETLLTEKNIHSLSESYLNLTAGVIQAKRGRNVEKYSKLYEQATTLYDKINAYIYSLNNQQFKGNSQTYQELIRSMRYMEVFNILILVLVMMGNTCLIITSTRSVTEPLKRLSHAADEVAGGNFDLEEIPVENYDEVGNVTRAFNQMVESIRNYIEELRLTMDRELQMQKHLKDAQLKYLQAQINPHFLYNTLNAGMQLAMMEGAENTERLLGNLSDFFRYNVKREEGDATLEEEIRLVDNYVYILNVRFSGDIHFEKEIDESLIDIRVPSMILQPLVENAVNYGIRNVDWEGHIELSVFKEGNEVYISVWDNGAGMEKERIKQVLEGKAGESDLHSSSNGVGIRNVMDRLRLYFKDQAKFTIFSEGKDMGTEIMIRIPMKQEGGNGMYRVMLADDEGIVLDSLKMIINRKFPDQCEIQTAKTGRDVIELAENFRPDVAFMDIQMPGINGIDAIREIKKNNPSTEFIVLSAYDKFDYAKEAINLGVLEYMNKPFHADMIEEVLNKAFKTVDSRKKKRSDDLKIKEKMETVMPIIESGFIYSIMFQEDVEEEVENYKQLLGIDCETGCMLVVTVGDDQKGSRMTNAVGASVRTQTNYNKIREVIKETWPCMVGSIMSNKIPVFLPMKEGKIDYEQRIAMIDICRELARKLKRMTDISFRIGIGSVRRLNESMTSYEEANKALANSTGSVAHVDDLPIQCRYDEEYPLELEQEIFAHLKDGKSEKCGQAAESFFDWMITYYGEDNMSVKLKILEFVLFAEHQAYQNGGLTYHFEERKDYLPFIMSAKENSDLKNWFVEKFKSICKNMATKQENHENSMIVKAKEYIQANYHKDLSLDEVSRQLDLSSYYFSKLFKEETGSNFLEYVTSLRMEKAKELLLSEDYSMKEICSAVGYSDPNYFSRIFKKNIGVTPTEYRERERV